MAGLTWLERTPKTEAEYEAAIDEILAEINAIGQRMDADQAEIERIKAETHQLKVETREILARLGAKL
jgi:peptidoglycan hydrolase CwlO-like protein